MVTLGFYELYELGYNLSQTMKDNKIEQAELVIDINNDDLIKVQEDLYYRGQEEKNTNDDFKPTNGDVVVKFPNINIRLRPKKV